MCAAYTGRLGMFWCMSLLGGIDGYIEAGCCYIYIEYAMHIMAGEKKKKVVVNRC